MSIFEASFPLKRKDYLWIALGLIALALRLIPLPQQEENGVRRPMDPQIDERVYTNYALVLNKHGWSEYPKLVKRYTESESYRDPGTPPPSRILYIFPGVLAQKILKNDTHKPLIFLSMTLDCAFVLGILWMFFRKEGEGELFKWASALSICFSPVAMGMSRFALADTFFGDLFIASFWFWLSGIQRQKNSWIWFGIVGWTLSLFLKELHLVFVPALYAVMWWNHDKAKPLPVWAWCSPIIPLGLNFIFLTMISGSISTAFLVHKTLYSKAVVNTYSLRYMSGPWYRYLVDYILVSPITFLGWLGTIFYWRTWKDHSWLGSNLVFGFAGLTALSLLPHHFDLRYGIACELALRAGWAGILYTQLPRRVWWGIVLAAFAVDVMQYQKIFIDGSVYDPVTFALARSLGLIP